MASGTPGALAFIALGIGQQPVPLNLLLPGCAGTVHTPSPLPNLVVVDVAGGASLTIPTPPNPTFCGVLVTGQYAEFQNAACPVRLGDAVGITIGN